MSYLKTTRTDSTNSNQFLLFHVQDDIFAFDISIVNEIIQNTEISVIPMMPLFIRGMINLRGHMIPVIDLQARLGKKKTLFKAKTCIIIITIQSEADTTNIGVLVDSARDIVEINKDLHIEPPAFGSEMPKRFIAGLFKHHNRFVTIIDSNTIFNIDDMASCIK